MTSAQAKKKACDWYENQCIFCNRPGVGCHLYPAGSNGDLAGLPENIICACSFHHVESADCLDYVNSQHSRKVSTASVMMVNARILRKAWSRIKYALKHCLPEHRHKLVEQLRRLKMYLAYKRLNKFQKKGR